MEYLLGKNLKELEEVVNNLALPKFTAKQIAQWLYQKSITSIDEMTNLSKDARAKLSAQYIIGIQPHSDVQESSDGTKKYLFPVDKHKFIEAAYIPDENRNTLCVSSQVGCKMGCLFCMTARQGFQAQLTAGQIVNQIRSLPEREKLTNIVYMGMGEPFDNIEEVLKSVELLTASYGMGFSPKKVTVSTIGIIPGMQQFLEESEAHLAISLHTPFDDERKKLMPVQNVYPVKEVIATLENFDFGKQRRISFEYIMFKGVNDTRRHVNELARLLNKLKCRINLIRFHPIPDTPLLGSDDKTIHDFKDALNKKGITTTIRASRGQDIYAACGLLSTKKFVETKEEDF